MAKGSGGGGRGWRRAKGSGRLFKQNGIRYAGIWRAGNKYVLKKGVRAGRHTVGTQTTHNTLAAAQREGNAWTESGK